MSARSRSAARARPGRGQVLMLVLIILLAALSGCATIPDSGPVVAGGDVEADPWAGLSQVGSEGPARGDTPEQIVSGFLNAAAGFNEDHRVARSFLTPQRRLAWRPDTSVAVYPNRSSLTFHKAEVQTTATPKPSVQPTATANDDPGNDSTRTEARDRAQLTRVEVTTPVSARIDADGQYRLTAPGETLTSKFTLARSGGEWRISALADGVLMLASDFDVTFRPIKIYFGDPTGRYLVPDLRWFPGTQDQPGSPELPTSLVQVLLKGPPGWLDGAVVTGAPGGTKMAVEAVVVADDVATVDLTDEVRSATGPQRQLLASQLEATLGQLLIGGVQITVRGLAFDIPAGSPQSPDDQGGQLTGQQPMIDPRVNTWPVVIAKNGELARLDNRTLVPVLGVKGLAVPGANRPAVSLDGTAFAVLNRKRTTLLLQLPGSKVATLLTSTDLTAPSFDPEGWLWTSPGRSRGYVYAAGTDAEADAVKVAAPWLKRMDVVALRISRDGTRAMLATRTNGGAHLFLAGVLRDEQGRPTQLSQPIGLVPDLETVRDLSWVDENQVVVLGRRAGERDETPSLVQIGGQIRSLNPAPGAQSITAGNGELSLLAGTSAGALARSGALWSEVSSARWPTFPG